MVARYNIRLSKSKVGESPSTINPQPYTLKPQSELVRRNPHPISAIIFVTCPLAFRLYFFLSLSLSPFLSLYHPHKLTFSLSQVSKEELQLLFWMTSIVVTPAYFAPYWGPFLTALLGSSGLFDCLDLLIWTFGLPYLTNLDVLTA